MVNYLMGNQQQAMSEANLAIKADGTERMKDNARAIRLLVSTRSNKPSAKYSAYLLGEFRWLDCMIKTERGQGGIYSNHYTDVKDRVVHRGLEPIYRRAGMDNAALAMCAMMSNNANSYSPAPGNDTQTDTSTGYSPWDEYFCKMDSLTADRLTDYYKYLSTTHSDVFETYCAQQTYHNNDYFNDLIGTKLIAEGRFADAIPYLKKVPLALLCQQYISPYAAKRHYDMPRWFGKQTVDDEYTLVKVDRNIKLDFCRDMTERISQYNLARNGSAKQQQAYDLAVRYYQASCYGDCWFLTHYYRSISDSARSWEKDFAAEAIKYLGVAKQSSDMQLRYKALYALAFMPIEPWYATGYDEKNDYKLVTTLLPQSRQYRALAELNQFADAHPNDIDDYTRRCDVLRRFGNK